MRTLFAAVLLMAAACGAPSNPSEKDGGSNLEDAGAGGGTGGGTGGGSGGGGGSLDAGTSSSALYCSHQASVAVPGLSGLTSTVSFTCTATTRTMVSNGLPDHAPGTFPNVNCPNTISAQSVTQSTTLAPAVASATGSSVKEPGHLVNGVKLDPGTAESYQNAGTWRIEAIQSYRDLGLDGSNAHVQPNGAYHYHGMPEGFMTKLGKGQALTFVGFAVDGFPIYAKYGYSESMNAASSVVELRPSWKVKATGDSGRPSTTEVPLGTFTEDYEYVAGSGDLDECNGRLGVTPEFPQGIYHYVITADFPHIQRCVKGTANGGNGGTGGGGGGGTGGGTGGGGGTGPKSCTTSADCTGTCPTGSAGCTCGQSPNGMICVPTCTTSADCPASPQGQAMTCNGGICRP